MRLSRICFPYSNTFFLSCCCAVSHSVLEKMLFLTKASTHTRSLGTHVVVIHTPFCHYSMHALGVLRVSQRFLSSTAVNSSSPFPSPSSSSSIQVITTSQQQGANLFVNLVGLWELSTWFIFFMFTGWVSCGLPVISYERGGTIL